MTRNLPKLAPPRPVVDPNTGKMLISAEPGADSLRTVRMRITGLAHALIDKPQTSGFLILAEPKMSDARLEDEWRGNGAILKDEIFERMRLCIVRNGVLRSLPDDLTTESRAEIIRAATAHPEISAAKVDYGFVVTKLLLLRWLTVGGSMTTKDLATQAGCSYQAVARVLDQLGSLIERDSDRRVRLGWFPRGEFDRLVANSAKARQTTRFADTSSNSRTVEAHLRRLEKVNPKERAIGGVVGARHYFPALDLVGTPRLDISVNCPKEHMNLAFVKWLDPALKQVTDPLQPANVVVHAVQHAESMFKSRGTSHQIADPVECLLDLHEAGLEAQAKQFLEHLIRNRQGSQCKTYTRKFQSTG